MCSITFALENQWWERCGPCPHLIYSLVTSALRDIYCYFLSKLWIVKIALPNLNSNMHVCMLSHFSHVWAFRTLWTIVHQAPLSMGFSRQELPSPLPGVLPHPGIKPESLMSPALAGRFLPLVPPGKPNSNLVEPNLSGKVQVSGIQLRIRKALIRVFKKPYISHIKKKKKLPSICTGVFTLLREGNGNPLQYSCLENPRDSRAWWAIVHGVSKKQTQLSDFTFTFHFHALEKEMATHSSVLSWRIPGTAEPGGLLSMGSHRVRHDWSYLAAEAFTFLYGIYWIVHHYKPQDGILVLPPFYAKKITISHWLGWSQELKPISPTPELNVLTTTPHSASQRLGTKTLGLHLENNP